MLRPEKARYHLLAVVLVVTVVTLQVVVKVVIGPTNQAELRPIKPLGWYRLHLQQVLHLALVVGPVGTGSGVSSTQSTGTIGTSSTWYYKYDWWYQ